MEEEFFSTIKLTNGEEIIAKVCYMKDEHQLLIENPKKVEAIKHRRNGETIEGFVLTEWIHSTYDQMFVIPMDQVLTMSELDKRIERYYIASLEGEDDREETGRVPASELTGRMGYLGSIKETKKKLEDIFKRS
ncbi:MAG: hypothetical protein ACO3CD_05260 [Candidatus Nanopelagicaceae bacterium]